MCPTSFLILFFAGLSMTSAMLRGGVENGEQLLRSGKVFLTSEQESYFDKSTSGYSEKSGAFWIKLSVCSGDRTGKDFKGVTRNFKHFLCPRKPWEFSSKDEHCCGKDGKQICCTFADSQGFYSGYYSGEDTMKSGMSNGSDLLEAGKVFVTPEQEVYFDKTDTGYSRKYGNFWSLLSVCSGNRTGKDFKGDFKTFNYFLCPKIPGTQFAFFDKDFCCGEDASQSCCSFFGYINMPSIFGLEISVEIIAIVIPLLCIMCCLCCGICCCMRGSKPSKAKSHARTRAAAPAFQQHQQQHPAQMQHQQQPYPAQMQHQQQPYPAQMPQPQPYTAQMPQPQPYTAQMPQPQPYTG